MALAQPGVGAVKALHRRGDSANVVINQSNVVVNAVVKLSATEERAIRELLRNPRLTASSLAAKLDVSPRQAQRIIASLKQKAGLQRRGADKNGEWHFSLT